VTGAGVAERPGGGPRFAPLDRADLTCPRDLGALLQARAEGRTPLAGGTDLLIAALHAGRLAGPAVWTGGVQELRGVDADAGMLRIGGAATMAGLLRSPAAQAAAPALLDGARIVGSVQIRNVATLAGNLCNGSPAADTVPGLAVHRARVELASHDGGTRSLGVLEFLRGPRLTDLRGDEVVTALLAEPLGPREGSSYRRFTVRRSMDLAFVGVAVRLGIEHADGPIASASIALGAVGPTVLMADEAAQALIGESPGGPAVLAAADLAAAACRPIDDVRSSAAYRRRLVHALVRECVAEAYRRAAARIGGEGA
jgi:CO/xanthine dehydrogenase FAD-binding subunit